MSVEPCPGCGRLTGVYRDAGEPRKHEEGCPLASTEIEFHISMPTETYSRMAFEGMLMPHVYREAEEFGFNPRLDEMQMPMPIRSEVTPAKGFVPSMTVATFRFTKRPEPPTPPAIQRLFARLAERRG